MTEATRDRLITAAMRLFADRGMRGTTVGDIEEDAGLTRRAGGFYKHFHSKEEVLEAGIERQIRGADTMRGVLELLPLGDLRAELTLLCRALLTELSEERDITRVFEKEGDQIPALRARMLERVIQVGYSHIVALAEAWVKEFAIDDVDVEAVVTVLIGSVVNYRRTQWTYGGEALSVDENRFVAAWVQTSMRLISPSGSG